MWLCLITGDEQTEEDGSSQEQQEQQQQQAATSETFRQQFLSSGKSTNFNSVHFLLEVHAFDCCHFS